MIFKLDFIGAALHETYDLNFRVGGNVYPSIVLDFVVVPLYPICNLTNGIRHACSILCVWSVCALALEMYIYTQEYVYIYTHIYIYICIYIYIYIYVCVCVCVCKQIQVQIPCEHVWI